MSRTSSLLAAALLLLAGCQKAPTPAAVPHQIHIVGSSAAYPFSTFAAERLMREEPGLVAPLVRADGSGAGIARFCDKPGPLRPDVAVVTRAMTPAEVRHCAANGIPHILSLPIGTTAFVAVVARRGQAPTLTRAALYRALTSPDARTWTDIDPRLPALPIRVEGPAPDPAIADGLFTLLLAPGCVSVGGENCAVIRIRRDGAYVGHGADAELVARAVSATSGAIGILPYAQAFRHRDALDMLPIDHVAPSPETITAGHYPASAPLLLLANADQAASVVGLPQLLSFYADALEPDGTFAQNGLIVLPGGARTSTIDILTTLKRH